VSTTLRSRGSGLFAAGGSSVYALCEAPLARISMQQRPIRSRVIGTLAGQQHVVAVFETIATP
jgi:hypothetical protein